MIWYWHVHHDILVGRSDDIDERIEYIRREKPADEIPLRLKLMQPVKDLAVIALLDKARRASVEAWQASDKARQAYDKARRAYDKAQNSLLVQQAHATECPDCPWNGRTIFPR